METAENLRMVELLCLISAGGSLGGVVAALSRLRIRDNRWRIDDADDANIGGRDFTSLAIGSILIGIGGAIAVQWALISIGKFRSSAATDDQMFILALSVIAGYGARRILPMLTDQLEKQLGTVRKEALTAVEEVPGSVKKEQRERADYQGVHIVTVRSTEIGNT